MQTRYGIILFYEKSFARVVAMGVIVRGPLTVWHVMMPFMFIFDFSRTQRETEIFARNFLFIKKLALDAAVDINKGGGRQGKLAEIENEAKDRLVSQKLYSWKIHQGQMAEVNLLVDHYSKLLEAEGKNYESLVKNAYKNREHFEVFLRQLTSIEKEIDRAVIVTLGETEEIWERMLAKQRVIDEMRIKGVRKLFLEARRD